jgi:beta-aspartyl-peptidase (threonine type)
MGITLVIHGGAGTVREADRQMYEQGLREARDAGFAVLERGGSALEAVLAAVTRMEDNPDAFNAGTGGVPNRDGVVECDAAVMAGHDRSSGAVAAITRAKNPVLVAELVRRESPHALIVGAGADALAKTPIENQELLTTRTREALERWREKNDGPLGSATVGAVALDGEGRLAAATSTGGVLGKWPGRVGDSPLIGAGTFADGRVAVSCTGKGESFIRAVAAKTVATLLEDGHPLAEAVQVVLNDVASLGGDGGIISVTADGQVGVGYNSPNMAYAWRTTEAQEARVGLEPGVHSL